MKKIGGEKMEWIITANPSGKHGYKVLEAFEDLQYVDWHMFRPQKNIRKGDIVYIYVGKPYSQIMLMTKCVKDNISKSEESLDDLKYYNDFNSFEHKNGSVFFRLKEIARTDDERLNIERLNQKGYVKGNIQGSFKSDNNEGLFQYINQCFGKEYTLNIAKQPPVVICSISDMERYDGYEENVSSGGSFPEEHGYGFELMNFHDWNGKCRGYVEIPRHSDNLNLARIYHGNISGDKVDGVTVIWITRNLIVGYYIDATAYAIRKTGETTHVKNEDVILHYSFEAKKQNCFCIPRRERIFDIGGNDGFKTSRSLIRYCDELNDEQEVKLKEALKYIDDIQNGKRWLIEDDSSDRYMGYEFYESEEFNNREYKDKPIDALPVTEKISKHYARDPKNATIARRASGYKCEINEMHGTFISRNLEVPYVEMHHLIPLSAQEQFEKSLDVPANIVALCSNCHNELHYGKDAGKLVEILYQQRADRLKKAGLGISLKKLLSYY